MKTQKLYMFLAVALLATAQDVNAMAGAKEFARKVLFSKSGAFAALCAAGFYSGPKKASAFQYDALEDTPPITDSEKSSFKTDVLALIRKQLHSPINDKNKAEIKTFFKNHGYDNVVIGKSPEGSPAAIVKIADTKAIIMFDADALLALQNDPSSPFSSNQIYAVLQHELSHANNNDGEHSIQLLSLSTFGALACSKAASLAAKARGLGRIGCATAALGTLYSTTLLNTVTTIAPRQRALEKRCDLSLETVEDLEHLKDFFQIIKKDIKLNFMDELLNEHPTYQKRIIYIEEEIAKRKAAQELEDAKVTKS